MLCSLFIISKKEEQKETKANKQNKSGQIQENLPPLLILGRLKVEFHISSSVVHFLREDSAMHKSSLLTTKLCLAKVSDRI